jgi:hypothetical protein
MTRRDTSPEEYVTHNDMNVVLNYFKLIMLMHTNDDPMRCANTIRGSSLLRELDL